MIENFEKNKHILTKHFDHENVKKFKNREHFIISVLKVGQGKKFLFLGFLYVFMLFWGGSKCSHFFFQKVFSKRVKKVMKTAKNPKKNFFFTKSTFKTVKIKCFRFFHFLPIS